ncbi:MAG: hypothetical protein MJ234_00410 [bacterium]|nr:hypothetical protein [bacterium]
MNISVKKALMAIIAAICAIMISAPSYAGTVKLPGGASINIPAGYTQEKSDSGIDFNREEPITIINVTGEDAGEQLPLSDLGKEVSKELEADGTMKVSYSSTEKINGRTFYVIYGKSKEDGMTLSMFVYITVMGNYYYSITFGCLEKDEEGLASEFNKIAGSLKK